MRYYCVLFVRIKDSAGIVLLIFVLNIALYEFTEGMNLRTEGVSDQFKAQGR